MGMFDRPIVSFDIETIPDPEIGRRVLQIEGDDQAVVLEMVQRRFDQTSGSQRYPQTPWHRVVCICVTTLDPATGSIEMRALHRELADERSLIAAFFQLFEASAEGPRLVSWNGNGFDLPVLRYRAMKHGLPAPAFYRQADERGRPSYTSRYDDLHVDVMDVLSGYGASSRAGLAMVCQLLELPGKSFLERDVFEHFYAGEHERIVEYCKLDTLTTLLVFLAWCVHTGTLPPAVLAAHMTTLRELVAREPLPAWAEVAAVLAGWPPWLG